MYISVYVYVHMYSYACMCTCIYIYIYICAYLCIHVYVCTCIYTYVYRYVSATAIAQLISTASPEVEASYQPVPSLTDVTNAFIRSAVEKSKEPCQDSLRVI